MQRHGVSGALGTSTRKKGGREEDKQATRDYQYLQSRGRQTAQQKINNKRKHREMIGQQAAGRPNPSAATGIKKGDATEQIHGQAKLCFVPIFVRAPLGFRVWLVGLSLWFWHAGAHAFFPCSARA